MGAIGPAFITGPPPRRLMLAVLARALASPLAAIALVMTWANPLFVGPD